MNTKTILSILLLSFSMMSGMAQKMKYKELYPLIVQGNYQPDHILYKLKEYKVLEPEQGNQYYQMAKIYYQRLEKFDILKQNNGALQVIDSSLHYYAKARQFIDSKEVKRRKEFYLEFLQTPEGRGSEKPSIKIIYSHIDNQTAALTALKQQYKKIHSDFNLAVDNYYAASRIFTRVHNTYSTFKEMCLLADADFLQKISKMNDHFDQSIKYLQSYQDGIKTTKINDYQQQYTLTDIVNYRLHGLTKANFLQNEFELWDYGKWYDDITRFIEEEITPLRELIVSEEKMLNAKVNGITRSRTPLATEFRIESDVLLLIKKYDPASFLVDLFKYKEAKVNLINSQILPFDSTDFNRRVSQYSDIIEHAGNCIASLRKAKSNTSQHLVKKHKDFVAAYYNNNVEGYISQEKNSVQPELDEASEGLYELTVSNSHAPTSKIAFLSINETDKLPLFKQLNSNYRPAEKEYVTLDIEGTKKSQFVSGYQYVNETRKPFVAYIGADTLNWLVFPKLNTTNDAEATTITPVRIGCAVLIHSYDEGQRSNGTNVLLELTTEGKQLTPHAIANPYYPADFSYSSIERLYVAAFHQPNEYRDSSDVVAIYKIGQEGGVQWETRLDMKGEILSIQPFDDEYLLTCNANRVQLDEQSPLYSEGTGVFSLLISQEGTPEEYFFRPASHGLATYVINNQDRKINILSFSEPETTASGKKLRLISLNKEMRAIVNYAPH